MAGDGLDRWHAASVPPLRGLAPHEYHANAQGSLKTTPSAPSSSARGGTILAGMDAVARLRSRGSVRTVLAIAVPLAVVTVAVALLEAAGLADASSVYLLAVVASGVIAGAAPAVVTALGAFVLYDFLFVSPHYTLTVDDAQEWLNLLLLLVVGVVVGRLAGRERDRAEAAIAREREANALVRTSFALATAPTAMDALPVIVESLAAAIPTRRLWVEVGGRVVVDRGTGATPGGPVISTLARRPGDRAAEWIRVHQAGGSTTSAAAPTATESYRVAITAGGRSLGQLWIERLRVDGPPGAGETRVLAAAADQLGRVLERDRLAEAAAAAEVSRRSDVLKSALLDSVSHDLRTPLASIRAAAGTLMDPGADGSAEERRSIAAGIDREADRLNRLVSNLLDMSRIDAGELRPSTAAFVLADLVDAAADRAAIGGRPGRLVIEMASDLPPVEVDDVLFAQVLANVLDNAERYAADATVRITAAVDGDRVRLTIEDDGPGVPDDALPRLFDKFYRAPRTGEGSRRGTGAGLTVVRGLMTALGGTATARTSDLGGLAIDLTIPVAGRVARQTASSVARA